MSDIFISYAREDRDKAERLARIFERQNWSVWWDKDIPPGRKYADVIGAELASAKAIVVLWSRTSIASDWVKDEAQEGANRGVLVPALIEKVNPPYGFRQVQTADLSDWNGSASDAELQSLVNGVGGLIRKPVSESALTTDGTGSYNGRLLVYILAGGALVLLLTLAAYSLWPASEPDNKNLNQLADGNLNRNINKSNGGVANCDPDARHKAAALTGNGLMMIDPGGNHEAAVLQFDEAIGECSSYAIAYFWRGQSEVALQKNDKAAADFKKVLELSDDADTRQKAQKFIAELEAPRMTPTPVEANTNTSSANTSTTNASANTSNANRGTTRPDLTHVQVGELYSSDKSTRIAATTRLIIEKKQDAATVQASVRLALAHPENKSGVINTLVYLENVDPAILKQNRDEIEKLLAVAKDNGAQTADHIRKVQALLSS